MTREDLANYKYIKLRITKAVEEYKEKFNAVTRMTSNMDGMPKARNKTNYSIEEFLDYSNKLIQLYNEDIKKEREIVAQLNQMTNEKYHTVLLFRYIIFCMEKNPLEKTASAMNYSYNEVCKFNGEALNEFDKLDKVDKRGKKKCK